MNVLGLHITGDQSSACLVRNGQVIAGASDERFTRQKRSREFPHQAIAYCMRYGGLSDLRELDAVAVSWNPARHMEQVNMSGFTAWRRYDPEWLYIAPNNLAGLKSQSEPTGACSFLWDAAGQKGVQYVDHHVSHIALSYYHSPFTECAALVLDEYGEQATASLAHVKDGKVHMLEQTNMPYSIGAFYTMFTEFLGFKRQSDEWKIMGAAAYGDPNRYAPQIRELIRWDAETNRLWLNLEYFNHYNLRVSTYCTPQLETLLGLSKRHDSDEMLPEHYDLAASVQLVFEEVCFDILASLHQLTGSNDLVLGGGTAMNSLLNGKILANTAFERLFVPYAAADNGCAMGAALWVSHQLFGLAREVPVRPPTPYLGPEFSNSEIEETLQKYKLRYTQLGSIEEAVVERLCSNQIVGWFQGRMEFGERALGNRSILADPRDANNKTLINAAIKYREPFRPFAPSVLEERMHEYFDVPVGVSVPYMEQVYRVRADKQEVIPAVTHNDGTGRLQSVDQALNPKYHKLIKTFAAKTGVPVVLNTSFNVQGEPIVCTPSDAIRTFMTSGLDALALGDFLVEKEGT